MLNCYELTSCVRMCGPNTIVLINPRTVDGHCACLYVHQPKLVASSILRGRPHRIQIPISTVCGRKAQDVIVSCSTIQAMECLAGMSSCWFAMVNTIHRKLGSFAVSVGMKSSNHTVPPKSSQLRPLVSHCLVSHLYPINRTNPWEGQSKMRA